MPDLRAFRALRYDPRAVLDAGAVLCPPYDVIDPVRRAALVAHHPRNAVHLELPTANPGLIGSEAGTAYRTAGRRFVEWQAEGTLRRDASARIYIYEQAFDYHHRQATARGFFCLLRLEEPSAGGGVRRHEDTLGAPKEDRFRLLSVVRANLSPVLMLYEAGDGGRRSSALLDTLTDSAPDIDAPDDAGNRHRLWPIAPDAAAAADLLRLAAALPLTIADGHHRYETALRYRDSVRSQGGSTGGGHEYILVLLYDASTGGLRVLPTHRVLGAGVVPATEILAGIAGLEPSEHFDDVAGAVAGGGRLGVWTREGGGTVALHRSVAAGGGVEGSAVLRSLAVNALDGLLRAIVGGTAGELAAKGRLSYSKDERAAAQSVHSGEAEAAFLVPPTPIESVLQVAARGEVMPQKSTYFVPKAATGLLFNPLAE